MTNIIWRVLIDTNIWISGFINPFGVPAQVLRLALDGRYRLVVSQPLLAEIEQVLSRPRVQRQLRTDEHEIERFLRDARSKAVWANPTGTLRLCRDPKDDIILETAILGEATHVITRDDDMKRDLDVIGYLHEAGIEVVSVAQFLALLESD